MFRSKFQGRVILLLKKHQFDAENNSTKAFFIVFFFFYLTFSRFIVSIFRNYFTSCKIVKHLKKNNFFCHHNFMKKVILICLKISLCMCVTKVGVLD